MVGQPQEIEEVYSLKVVCKGSESRISDGHPKVWLKIPLEKGSITCPYCEKTFVYQSKQIY